MSKPIFVFDSNALISANLLRNSVSREAYEKALRSGILIRSLRTFQEFSTRFIRPKFDKYLPMAERLEAIARYKKESRIINPRVDIRQSRDPDDDKYLELAIAAEASCIISGDKDLLVLNPFRDIPILSAAEFISQF